MGELDKEVVITKQQLIAMLVVCPGMPALSVLQSDPRLFCILLTVLVAPGLLVWIFIKSKSLVRRFMALNPAARRDTLTLALEAAKLSPDTHARLAALADVRLALVLDVLQGRASLETAEHAASANP